MDTVNCCRECYSSKIEHRPGGMTSHTPDAPDWCCKRCGAEFETPEEREKKHPGMTAERVLAQFRETEEAE